MTDSETRVLARTAAVLLVVSAVRYGWETRRGPPDLAVTRDDGPALLAESRKLKADNDARAKPLGRGEKLDPNRATDAELDRLPGLGPAAAKAIVESREKNGGFATVDDLLDVPGIGPATMNRIRPFLELSNPGIAAARRPAAGQSRRSADRAPSTRTAPTNGSPQPPLDLNAATQSDLERLPGVGPSLAKRILESRAKKGHFTSPEDLLEVYGIGPATLNRLRPLLRAGGGPPTSAPR